MAAAVLGTTEYPWWDPPERPASGPRVTAQEGPNGTTLVVGPSPRQLLECSLSVVAPTPIDVEGLPGTTIHLSLPGVYDSEILVAAATTRNQPVLSAGTVQILTTITLRFYEVAAP